MVPAAAAEGTGEAFNTTTNLDQEVVMMMTIIWTMRMLTKWCV